MLFEDISLLDADFELKEHMYVGVHGGKIAYISDVPPETPYYRRYSGRGKLLMPGFYNAHAHTPMTLMRGYGENLPLAEWLSTRIFPFEAKLTGRDVYWGMLLGLAESMRFGIVSSSDMYNFCAQMGDAILESGMKGNIGRHIVAFSQEDLHKLDCFLEAEDFRRGYHGAAGGRVLADASLHAEYTSTPKVARQLAEHAQKEGLRMQVHLSETRQEVEGCLSRHQKTPPKYLYDLGLFDVPATAAHCVWLEEGDFELLAQKGVTIATCPASNLKLGSGVLKAPQVYRAGIPLALGTDSVASNNSLNFIEEIKLFALIHKGVNLDPTIITPKQALYAATYGGAQAQGRPFCGKIELGYAADLIVLDIQAPHMRPAKDMAAGIVYSASGSDVLLTMVDGQVLYQNGEYKTIDIEKVVYEAERAFKAVCARI